jgi:hypothetical protein
VRSDAVEIVALGNKVGLKGGVVHKGVDVLANDMNVQADGTERGCGYTLLGKITRGANITK